MMKIRMLSLASLAAALVLLPASRGLAQETVGAEASRHLDVIRKVSNILNADVRGTTGDKVADVADLVMDRQGRPQYVILGAGGVLGIGQDHVAVPFRKLETMRRDESGQWTITVPMTQQQIEGAPTIVRDDYAVLSDSQWNEKNNTYFEVDALDDSTGASGEMIRAGALLDAHVTNVNGEELANVEDILIDRQGKAIYVILGAGGFLGIGEDRLAVPFDRLNIAYNAAEGETMVSMNTTREKLEAGPRMQGTSYEQLQDADYVVQINRYYVVDADRELDRP